MPRGGYCSDVQIRIEGGEDVDDSDNRGMEDVDGAAGAGDADGARVSATSERTPDGRVGLEQQHEKRMRASRISTMLEGAGWKTSMVPRVPMTSMLLLESVIP